MVDFAFILFHFHPSLVFCFFVCLLVVGWFACPTKVSRLSCPVNTIGIGQLSSGINSWGSAEHILAGKDMCACVCVCVCV